MTRLNLPWLAAAVMIVSITGTAFVAHAEGEKADAAAVSESPESSDSKPAFSNMFFSFSKQSSDRYNGEIFQVGAEAKPWERWTTGLGAFFLSRHYSGANIDDASVVASAARAFDGGRYFESAVSFSPDAKILPRWTASFMPHQVLGSTDIALGFDYREYEKVTAGTLHPLVRHDFSDRFAVAAGAFLARSHKTMSSVHGDLIYKPFEYQTAKLSVAGGESLEDAGVSATFSSVYLSYGVALGRWGLIFDGTNYWSSLRHETSFGVRVEYRGLSK